MKDQMSMTEAAARIRSLRFRHLGFGLFWAVSFVMLWETDSIMGTGAVGLFYVAERLIVAVVPIIVAAASWRRSKMPSSDQAVAVGVILAAGVWAAFAASWFPGVAVPLALMAAVLIGISNGLFFLLWQVFFSAEGPDDAAIHIPTSAVLSVVIFLVVRPLPSLFILLIAGVLLPVIATIMLVRSLRDQEIYSIDTTPESYTRLIGPLARPVFCVVSFAFVWQAASEIAWSSSAAESEISTMLALAGFTIAALILAVAALFFSRRFNILRVYQALFPVITGAFLLLPFLGGTYGVTLTAFLMFGFELVNLLLIFVCAEISHRYKLNPIVVYGFCIGPVLLAMTLGHLTGGYFSADTAAYDFVHLTGITLATIYLFSVALLVVFRGRESSIEIDFDEGAQNVIDSHTDFLDERTERLGREHRLSPSEMRVLHLVVRGHTVASISERLHISENTIRGHMKSIYRKLDVHSRQDILNAVDPDR